MVNIRKYAALVIAFLVCIYSVLPVSAQVPELLMPQILGMSADEAANFKADRLVINHDVVDFIDEKKGYMVSIQDIQKIPGGVQVLMRAFQGEEQFGFGVDGTVDIERVNIYNPPLLVLDPDGLIEREYVHDKTGEVFVTRYREDLTQALKNTLVHVVETMGTLATEIEEGSIGHTVSTFYPSSDGYVGINNAANWAAAYGGNGDTAVMDSTSQRTGISESDPLYSIRRAGYCFDTSSLPDSDTVSDAVISLYPSATSNTDNDGDDTENFYDFNPASTVTYVTTDFENAFGSTAFATPIDIGSITTGVYNDWTLNSSGKSNITLTGTSCFGFREGHDAGNLAITLNTSNNITAYFSEQGGSSTDPVLVITHSAGGGGGSSASSGTGTAIGCSGTGCNINGTGNIIMYHNECTQYSSGTGFLTCTRWDTAIEIPAIKFWVDRFTGISIQSVIAAVLYFMIFWWVKSIFVWIFKILTQRAS